MTAIAPQPMTEAAARRGWRVIGLWLLAAIPLLIALDGPPAQRTQEARVLETARQMLGHGPQAWLIPSLNGEIRVRKPPLAYWMAAVSFKLFGVSEWTGRLPTIVVSWLTVGETYLIAKRLFGGRAALLSAACLLSSYLFFRQGRLAETDAPAALLATVAIDWFWRATESDHLLPFHLAAAATGLAFFAKQGAGCFPLLFFIGYAPVRRRNKAFWRFAVSGAPITLLVVAGWWYGYAALSQGLAQFRSEWAETTEGLDHPASFYAYFPMLLLAIGPWFLVTLVALAAAAKRARLDPRLAGLLVWAAAVFVPLCFLGNKQFHYLLPLMPALAILAGWWIDQDSPMARTLIGITIIASIASPIALLVGASFFRGGVVSLDILLAIGIALASLMAWIALKRRGAIAATLMQAGAWAVALSVVLGVWGPTIGPSDIRETAAAVGGQFGRGPYVFFGGDTSLPLCFALREEIPRIDDNRPDLLEAAARQSPSLAVIWEIPQHGAGPHWPPADFARVGADFGAKGQHFRIYQKRD
jgi:Dolichyl-phosphate-mannose-protein mannosyltransferase